MVVAFFPAEFGTVCVVGLMETDMKSMLDGSAQPGTIDMREAVERGIALATLVQIVAVKDRADFDRKIVEWLESMGVDATDKMIPLNDMPSPFEEN